MLLSITYILMLGMMMGWLCKKIKLPALCGFIITGIVIGPAVLNLIDSSILDISTYIRKIALIIILIRAGLKLSIEDLKKAGRAGILMCFVPACLEILGMVIIAPKLLGISILDAAILGAVISAVSPAVIVPKMISLIDQGYGVNKGIPQMILAGASVDDVFVIVMFTTFTTLAKGGNVNVLAFVNIPLSIVLGIGVGLIVGFLIHCFFKQFKMRDTVKAAIILCMAFALVSFEDNYGTIIPFASLIGVMAMGLELKRKNNDLAIIMSKKFDKLWVIAEVFLFVLVGASLNISKALDAGIISIILVLLVLLFRMLGVWICQLQGKLNLKERMFCMLAYTPKATVQAAIGALPLAMGLSCGEIVLTVSVIAILLTAPLGAFAIDLTYQKWLNKREARN